MPKLFHLHPPSILARWIAANRALRFRRQVIRQLRTLSDWQLADIGIAREQIADVASGMVLRGGCHAPAVVTPIDANGHTGHMAPTGARPETQLAA